MCCYLFCWEIPIRSTFLNVCQMQQEESLASSYWFYCYSMYLRLLWEFCHRCSEAETRPSIQSVSRGLCYHLCYHLPISYLSGTTWGATCLSGTSLCSTTCPTALFHVFALGPCIVFDAMKTFGSTASFMVLICANYGSKIYEWEDLKNPAFPYSSLEVDFFTLANTISIFSGSFEMFVNITLMLVFSGGRGWAQEFHFVPGDKRESHLLQVCVTCPTLSIKYL